MKKEKKLLNSIRFIYGTILSIRRPTGGLGQWVAHGGHMRKHAIKFQALNTPPMVSFSILWAARG